MALSMFVKAQDISHCNSLLDSGISDITRFQDADHAITYKWHSSCGFDYSSATDDQIKKAGATVFGYGSGSASGSTSQIKTNLKKWCEENREFAESNKKMYEEASTINKPALDAWNQCQEIAKKGVAIKVNALGEHSDFVHFEIDSTLDSDLRLFPESTENYTCTKFITPESGPNKGKKTNTDLKDQPLIKNGNIHFDCKRRKPIVDDLASIKRLNYPQAYISIQTSGPSLQFYARPDVDEYFVTPPKSVLAFSDSKCPKGWSEYTPARGRFIRGIDTTDSKTIDPDGKRNPGGIQGDATRLPNSLQVSVNGEHTHVINEIRKAFIAGNKRANGEEWSTVGMFNGASPTTSPSGGHSHAITGGDVESRPKNVALLYCEKN